MSAARSNMQALFAAAREDAPSASTHDGIWERLEDATRVAAAGTGAAAMKAAVSVAAPSGMKLLAAGGAIGAVCTALGVVVTIVAMTVPGTIDERPSRPVARAVVREVAAGARPAGTVARKKDEASVRDDDRSPTRESDPTRARAKENVHPSGAGTSDNSAASELDEEARLVTEARAAIVIGQPARALALVEATRRLSSRVLEPEELGLEVRALRGLGRDEAAAEAERVLRRRYPDHALAH
ncbi:hypothetical protein AKJ09_01133 [Labilithrix luteola]|uniref:Uncharacterized protein n=1 Tax=Labilithrix luteola TaxID=1391654 RepID=A0A0K1PMX9_9BACT|nr:hypothetical protein [Labilithrix luteola]AKU94469.1 hypothetical protein AKJ09_01133 [Labilithrix luteola]